jgi:hypothetical protein
MKPAYLMSTTSRTGIRMSQPDQRELERCREWAERW